ncbi:unnamed protein product [Rhizophagus irregularis]|nr:unnamed protein product [Rhizophagus irregularis]CAB4404799.1 unnamed protein product [Rhizophagus irregularis]
MEELDFQLVKRPGIGDEGKRIRVRANFFEVTRMQREDFSHYDVTTIPKVPQRLNRKVFDRFVEQNRYGALTNARPVFDGRANMFAHKPLRFESDSFDVELEEEGTPVSRARPPQSFRIRIKKTGDIVVRDLFQFLNARGDMTNNCLMAITGMDIIISHKISAKFPTVRRSFYNPQVKKSLGGGLEAYQGYYQSARPTMSGRMMINVDLSATAFYESGPLIDTVVKILENIRTLNDLRRGLSTNDRHKVEDFIRGLKIKDNHRTGPGRKFKVEGLTPTPASHTTFDRGDGSEIDVKTYFQNAYNIRLSYPSLPCVAVKGNVYLPMEVCDIAPEQRYMRKLNRDQTDLMMNFTRQNPSIRANKIQDGLKLLNYRENEYLQQFGMSISNEMAVVNARILPTPTIEYRQATREFRVEPKNGVWNLRDKTLAMGATLGSWSVLAFLNENTLPNPVIEKFLVEFTNTCHNTGMNIITKKPPIMHANPQGNIEESLKQAWINAGNAAKSKPQLILCILPGKGQELYAEIKRVSDTIIGVPTQCIQRAHLKDPKVQYCANVCLKINVKLGGMNSSLLPKHIKFVDDAPTILIGADVSHPAPGDKESPSYAALCGSIDSKASRYAATIRVQTRRYEIIVDLGNMVKELLKVFYQSCGHKPRRIIFYRDGVSEGQFNHVLKNELNAIRDACQALGADYKPTITFIVVQKRHHTRFFPMEKQNSDFKSGNCLPGTVVEEGITHPFEFDFYLLSHPGLLGTSRPTHYHVLYDKNGFDANSLQTLSYNLCYLYVRCTRAVSLVPPVYYAHLVTNRAKLHAYKESNGEITSKVVKEDLKKVMYFA